MNIITINPQTDGPKRCVISLGIGKPVFRDSLLRLGESLKKVGFTGDYIYWDRDLPDGCPQHFEAPFAFKSYCFQIAQRMGYQQVLWMDSACVAIRSLDRVFENLSNRGYALFDNNYDQMMGQWISDEALAKNGIDRETALLIPEIPCSVIGLDLHSPLALAFLDQWHTIMTDGLTARGTAKPIRDWNDYQAIFWNRNGFISSDPRVKGHRCDQPAAGIVAHRLGLQPYADELRDIHYPARPVASNTCILHHREFGEQITPLNQIYRRVFFEDPYLKPLLAQGRSLRSGLKRLIRQAGSPLV